MFITAEGIDGTGKSSVLLEVVRRLMAEGHEMVLTKEPTDTWTGQAVRRGISEKVSPYTEALLFTADRTLHIQAIKDELAKDRNVISDRYFDSTIAYQAARLEEVAGGDKKAGFKAMRWLEGLNKPFVIVPDKTLLFMAPPALCLKRVDSSRTDRSDFEREAFLGRVQHFYGLLAKKERERFVLIDAEQPYDVVTARVERIVRETLDKGSRVVRSKGSR